MFKTATRYLSGVSVFYGDDITRRSVNGEVVIAVGPSIKGPREPIALRSIDNSVALYGVGSPLVKALYEFHNGYEDSPGAVPVRYVALRVGGKPAQLSTSYGLTLETTDAYDGIENDYYIYVDNATPASAKVKVWDKNKMLVFDSAAEINTGHVTVSSLPAGDGGVDARFGKDVDADVNATPVTLAQIVNWDLTTPGGVTITPTAAPIAAATSIVTGLADVSLIPASGVIAVTGQKDAMKYVAYASYTFDQGTKTFTLDEELGVDFTGIAAGSITIYVVGSELVKGDSELDLTNRELYMKFRNALLDVEQFTPDYLVPAGATFDATQTYTKTNTQSTVLTAPLTNASTFAQVDAAANVPTTGSFTVDVGTFVDTLYYNDVVAVGEDFKLMLANPTYVVKTQAAISETTLVVEADVTGAPVSKLGSQGYITIGAQTVKYTANADGTLTLATGLLAQANVAAVVTKVPGPANANTSLVTITWASQEKFELGIGYVKETDEGGFYSFEWSDTKQTGYNIAHFGYLFAKYCNDAAVGYSTPLCGMNLSLPASLSRADISAWIGTSPEKKVVAGMTDAVEAIVKNGTGLLGNPVMAGSVKYNRCYLTDKANNEFADPAFGFLLTDEGFVDGREIRDTFFKLVDLGKFMCVGAGLLTFSNRASGTSYVDTMGIYALGRLAGTPKGEGISFAKIGANSGVTVTAIIHRKLAEELAGAGYIVPTREQGLGWVINNDPSVARDQSAYVLISTTRTVKTVIEAKRAALSSFIGKPMNRYYYEAARTKLADLFKADVGAGLLRGYQFDLQISEATKAIGKLYLKCVVNPPLELTQVDIDTVIDRNVVTN